MIWKWFLALAHYWGVSHCERCCFLSFLPDEIDLQHLARQFFFFSLPNTHTAKPALFIPCPHLSLWASGQCGWMAATVVASILMFPLHGGLFHYKNWLEMMCVCVCVCKVFSFLRITLYTSAFSPNSYTGCRHNTTRDWYSEISLQD